MHTYARVRSAQVWFTALAASVAVATLSAQSPAPATSSSEGQSRSTTQRIDADTPLETLRGCIARDDSARGQVGASQQTGAQQTALLRHAERTGTSQAGSASASAQRTTPRDDEANGTTYRLVSVTTHPVTLPDYDGHHVEVRGVVSAQPGSDADRTATQGEGTEARVTSPATDFDDSHHIVTVASVRTLSETCPHGAAPSR